MPTLDFKITTTDNFKGILLTDMSSDIDDNTYILKSLTVSTVIDGLWTNIKTSQIIDLENIIYPNELLSVPVSYNQGVVILIPVSELFSSSADFVYDNIYTVTVTIEDEMSSDIIVNYKQNLLFPLSTWYKNNIVMTYNYHDNDLELMKTIVKYQTWIDILVTSASYGESGTIEVILKTFKRLIDGYRLPQ